MRKRFNKSRGEAGFSLVEVLIALAIVAVSFLVTYGTISYTLNQSARILGETKGTALIQQVVADIGNGITGNLTQSPLYKIGIPSSVSAASLAANGTYYYFDDNGVYLGSGGSSPANAVFRVSVALNEVASGPNNIYKTCIVVYFPAQVDPILGYPNLVSVVTNLSN